MRHDIHYPILSNKTHNFFKPFSDTLKYQNHILSRKKAVEQDYSQDTQLKVYFLLLQQKGFAEHLLSDIVVTLMFHYRFPDLFFIP